MILASLLLLLAKVTVVLALGLLLASAMRRASASARHLVWLTALTGALSIPLVESITPLRLALLPASFPATVFQRTNEPPAVEAANGDQPRVFAGLPERTGAPDELAGELTTSPSLVSPDVVVRSHLWSSTAGALLVLWLGAALVIVAWLVRGWVAANGIVRRARVVTDARWLAPMYEVADRIGLDESPRLVQSHEVRMPFACGLITPTIVLPGDCDAWSSDRRRAVLLHELAHVRRRDLIGHVVSRLVCAVYWFHPMVWMAARRLRLESEQACDDLAVHAGARASDYAEHLLDIVTSVRSDSTPALAMAMARRGEFEGRMLAILDPDRPRRGVTRRQAAILLSAMGASSVLVGAVVPSPVATPVASSANHERPGPPSAFEARTQLSMSEVEGKRSVERDAERTAWLETGVARVDGNDRLSTDSSPRPERAISLARMAQSDSSATVRRAAVWGLKDFAAEFASARAALVAVLRDDIDLPTREMAAWALSEAGDFDGGTALSEAVQRDDAAAVRATAAWSLGRIKAVSAMPALTAALSDSDRRVRIRAAWALGSINAPKAPPALVAMLNEPSDEARHMATWAIRRSVDATAVPAVRAALEVETNRDVRVAYLRTLAALGAKSTDAIQALIESGDPTFREEATRLLAGSGRKDPWPWPWPEARPSPTTIW